MLAPLPIPMATADYDFDLHIAAGKVTVDQVKDYIRRFQNRDYGEAAEAAGIAADNRSIIQKGQGTVLGLYPMPGGAPNELVCIRHTLPNQPLPQVTTATVAA